MSQAGMMKTRVMPLAAGCAAESGSGLPQSKDWLTARRGHR
jgi:hypothetical protein